jgi:anti-anti-sigma factor
MTELAELRLENRDGTVVARVSGEIDASNAARLSEDLLSAVTNDDRALVIDFTDTRYLDSSAIQLVFEIAAKLELRRQQLRIVAPAGSFAEEVLRTGSLGAAITIEQQGDRKGGG